MLKPAPNQSPDMRSAWLLAFALLSGSTLAANSGLELVRVWPGPRTAESFERISEYFTGRENPGGQTIVRSQPAARAGFYWLIRTRNEVARSGVTIELSVTLPGTEAPKTHVLRTDVPAGRHVTLAGITGADWPDLGVEPVTWQLRILDASGLELARDASFLWSESTR